MTATTCHYPRNVVLKRRITRQARLWCRLLYRVESTLNRARCTEYGPSLLYLEHLSILLCIRFQHASTLMALVHDDDCMRSALAVILYFKPGTSHSSLIPATLCTCIVPFQQMHLGTLYLSQCCGMAPPAVASVSSAISARSVP